MSVTVYKGTNFEGVFARLGPGLYAGRDLVGCYHQSSNCEELDNAISSIRVDPNVIVAFADARAVFGAGVAGVLSAGGAGGARVLIGPAEVPDLAALGMGGRISSVAVRPYRAYDLARPPRGGGATVFDSYGATGRREELRRGDYSAARLASEEVKFPGERVVSLSVAAGALAVLYAGGQFEAASDAVVVAGESVIDDVGRLGLGGRIGSIRILYSDTFDKVPSPWVRRDEIAPWARRDAIPPWVRRGAILPPPAVVAALPTATLPCWWIWAVVVLLVVIAAAAALGVRRRKAAARNCAARAAGTAEAAATK